MEPYRFERYKKNKQERTSHDRHSLFVRTVVKTCASSYMIAPNYWLQLVSAVLKDNLQLQWKCYWREEGKALEQWEKAKGFEVSQDQIVGEDYNTDSQNQALNNRHILSYTI